MSNRVNSPDVQSDTPIDGAFGVDVTTGAATVIRTAHRSRIVCFLTNPSDTDMYIGLGEDPVATAGSESGIYLAKSGGSLTIDNWTGDIRAIHLSGATKRITGAVI